MAVCSRSAPLLVAFASWHSYLPGGRDSQYSRANAFKSPAHSEECCSPSALSPAQPLAGRPYFASNASAHGCRVTFWGSPTQNSCPRVLPARPPIKVSREVHCTCTAARRCRSAVNYFFIQEQSILRSTPVYGAMVRAWLKSVGVLHHTPGTKSLC